MLQTLPELLNKFTTNITKLHLERLKLVYQFCHRLKSRLYIITLCDVIEV